MNFCYDSGGDFEAFWGAFWVPNGSFLEPISDRKLVIELGVLQKRFLEACSLIREKLSAEQALISYAFYIMF